MANYVLLALLLRISDNTAKREEDRVEAALHVPAGNGGVAA